MVVIAPPPPVGRPEPAFFTAPAKSRFVRMYDPTRFNATATSFRINGPRARFDHQRESNGHPTDDCERGILYAGATFSCCVVEAFGDRRIIDAGDWEVAVIETSRDLLLLDLRNDGAMRAGTVAAVCKDSDHRISQSWSRFFYENAFFYGKIDGIIFGNAHNDEDSVALYERCDNAIIAINSGRLANTALRSALQLIAVQYGLRLSPYKDES